VRPDARWESVGELLLKLQRALLDGDALALERRVYRLNYAIRVYDPLCKRFGCRDASSLGEARQRILLRLYAAVQRRGNAPITSPDGFARRTVEWELSDYARERRRRLAQLDQEGLEKSGIYESDDLLAKFEGERLLEEARQKLHAFVGHYTSVAAAEGRGRLGARHVGAWFALRVQGRPADEVARMLGVAESPDAGRALVWQWAKRGRDLVLRVATSDTDPERARVMRAAALGGASEPAPSSRTG